MSSIGSVGMSSMNSMNNMQRPDPMGVFKKTDSDGSGGVSQVELKNLTADSDTTLQSSAVQSVSSSSQDQIKELQKLLEALTTYVNSNNSDSNSLISIYT